VLGNTWAWPVNGEWHFEWFSRLMGGSFGRFAAKHWNLFVNGFMTSSMRRGPMTPAVRRACLAPLRDPKRRAGTHVFPASIIGSRDFLRGIESRLCDLDAERFLFLWPDRDVAFRDAELIRWRSILPAASIVHLRNCGHYIFEEAGGECADALANWLVLQKP
jgi:haloalkane dehalogenase